MAKKYEFKPDKPRSGILSKLFLTRKQRRSLLKWTLYALVLVVLSVLQDVIFSRFHLLGGTTELVPMGIFLICLTEGAEKGSVFALVASFCYLFSGSAAGYHSVVFITALAIAATAFRQSYLQRSFGAFALCSAVAMVIYQISIFLIAVFLGTAPWSAFLSVMVTAALTAPFIAPLYPILNSIAGGEKAWNE